MRRLIFDERHLSGERGAGFSYFVTESFFMDDFHSVQTLGILVIMKNLAQIVPRINRVLRILLPFLIVLFVLTASLFGNELIDGQDQLL